MALVADDNGWCGSQFFITLAKTEWLDGEHTIFGTIDGDTVFNLLNIAAIGEVDGFDIEDQPFVKSVE